MKSNPFLTFKDPMYYLNLDFIKCFFVIFKTHIKAERFM